MEIPNYDNNGDEDKFIYLHDFMPNKIFRMLICGGSGSGKTNLLLHILKEPLIYYDKLYIYAKNLEQTKYQELIKCLSKIAHKHKIALDEILEYSNDDIINVSELNSNLQKVIIFDDYVCEKNQNDIINYFIQGRHKNCCVIYLSQSYFKTPKDIRLNCSHYIIYSIPSKREVNLICNEQDVTSEQYKDATKKPYDFLYLDKPRKLIKRNFYGDL